MFKCWASLVLLLLFNTVGPCAKSPYDAPHTTRRRPRPRPRPRAGGIWLGREQAVRVKRPYLASVSGHARARVFGHSTSRTTQRWLLKLNVGLLLLAAPTVVLLLLLTLCTLFSAQRYTTLVYGNEMSRLLWSPNLRLSTASRPPHAGAPSFRL